MKKNIYINGRFLTQNVTGVQRVAEQIVKELDITLNKSNIFSQYKIIILVPNCECRDVVFKNIEIRSIGILKGHLWEQIELPLFVKKELLINLCNTGPMIKKNQLVMIHDAAICSAPEGFSKKFVLWYKLLYKQFSRNSRRIVTVSNFSKEELLRYYPKMDNKLGVIYNGVDHVVDINPDEKILSKNDLEADDYILAVSSMNPNKNFRVIGEALAKSKRFSGKVVIAGGNQTGIFADGASSVGHNIKWVGYVTDEELVALYKNARIFIFPSLYEGFGLPPLEAMRMGCVVIASNAASIPEICKEHAIYFDPNSPEDLLNKIESVYENKILRVNQASKALEFSKEYRWSLAARILINYIKELA
ncbi:glycosyltransferase family 1 protein [Bacillus cereus group sp. TH153LC]|uniref:glycosyltransferase family 4 protein n=1 Tax=Bacillus cereus group sp. TH153LC TaxID=3018059 RepID=UPI0022E70BE7|nr:glycosyltransferase family 1 protein [Bacillus cereus group sp. TH153LC]MDA1663056.1 glycosyltransferase family 1 protein [Bacillus cereus group sp. TH153LC]